jgi:hypothetical protein
MKMFVAICATCILVISVAMAQTVDVSAKPITDTDIQLLRSDV